MTVVRRGHDRPGGDVLVVVVGVTLAVVGIVIDELALVAASLLPLIGGLAGLVVWLVRRRRPARPAERARNI